MSNDDFTIDEEIVDGVTKLFLKGRITSMNANVMQYKLNDAFAKGQTNIVVNMMQVVFLSSAGIRVLLMFFKKAQEAGGSFFVESPSENVANVLGMTALDEMLLGGSQGAAFRG